MQRLAADAILVLHALFVAFVVFGQAAILVGHVSGWRWILNPWFRSLHVLAIGVVAAQAWLGRICPLTTWEMALRERAGRGDTYEGSFVAYWLHRLLFFEAPGWVFTAAYTLFALVVLASWVWIRPRSFRQ